MILYVDNDGMFCQSGATTEEIDDSDYREWGNGTLYMVRFHDGRFQEYTAWGWIDIPFGRT